jgi:hypothetical protein
MPESPAGEGGSAMAEVEHYKSGRATLLARELEKVRKLAEGRLKEVP